MAIHGGAMVPDPIAPMECSQFQRLVQIIDIRIVPFAGNILKRNLASIIDGGYEPHVFCVEPISQRKISNLFYQFYEIVVHLITAHRN